MMLVITNWIDIDGYIKLINTPEYSRHSKQITSLSNKQSFDLDSKDKRWYIFCPFHQKKQTV